MSSSSDAAIKRLRDAIDAMASSIPSSVMNAVPLATRIEVNNALFAFQGVISDLEYAAKNWERIAVYFGDCEAATLEGLASIKGSQSETKRHISICRGLIESLSNGTLVGSKSYSDMKRTIDRLDGAVTRGEQKIAAGRKPKAKKEPPVGGISEQTAGYIGVIKGFNK